MLALIASGLLQATSGELIAIAPQSYSNAVLARQNGKPAEARRLLKQWLDAHPGDVDALLQYGFALLDLDRTVEADAAFRQVLKLAPNYFDARLGLARLAQRRGDFPGAQKWLSFVPVDYAEARPIRAQLAQAVKQQWSLDTGAALTAVGGNQPDWREVFLQLGFKPDARTNLSGRVEASHRFGLRDYYGEVQITHRFSTQISGHLVAGGTADPDYRAQWQMGGGVSAHVLGRRNATVVSLDMRTAKYRTGQITTLQPGIEQHFFGDKAWVSSRLIVLADHGRVHAGALGRIDVKAGARLRLFGGAAYGPDTSNGFVSRVTSHFGGIEAALGSRQVLRLSLAQTNQQVGTSRTEFALSTGLKF